jgi:hypothetical protein
MTGPAAQCPVSARQAIGAYDAVTLGGCTRTVVWAAHRSQLAEMATLPAAATFLMT